MSESDREKLLKLREPREVTAVYVGKVEAPPITGVVTIESDTPPKRPMTEAEEKLIAVCLDVSPVDLSDWRTDGFKAYCSAVVDVHRERMPKDARDKLVEAKKAYDEAYAKLKEIKAVVPGSIREEIYKEHGWDTRHA